MAKKVTTRQDHEKLIDEYIYQREQLLQKKVGNLAITLFDRVFNEYLQRLEQSNGKILNNTKNLNAVNGLDAIYNKFNLQENVPVVKSFIDDAIQLTPMNEKYFKIVSDRPVTGATKRAKAETYKMLGVNNNGTLTEGGFAQKFIKDKTLLVDIKRITVKNIVQNKGFLQLKNELKQKIEGVPGKPLSGGLQQYYRNYAYDTMMNVDRQNAEVFANDLGIRFFYWSGGIIKTSRALCIKANGHIFDSYELKKMTYNDLQPVYRDGLSPDWIPLKHLGYHACRHRKNYISDEEAAKHREKWFDLNTIANKVITPEKKPLILNKKQKEEFKNFPKDTSLKGDNARLQDESIKTFIVDKERLTKAYIDRFGNTANTDDARKLFTDIGYNGLNASAVHEASSALNKEAIKSMISSSKSNTIEMFAGGAGSGKTSAISGLKPDLKNSAAAIIDGNLAGFEGAVSKVNDFLSKGKEVNITYVYREPEDAWKNGVIKRMLENEEEKGRVVTLKTFLHNTEGSYNTIKKMFAEGFEDTQGVNIDIIDNSLGRGNTTYMDREKFNGVVFGDALKQHLLKVTKELLDSGRINKEQYEALIAE